MTDLLNTSEASHHIGLSPSWLNKSRMDGSGPVYLKIGRLVRYTIKDLDIWLSSKRRTAVYDFNNRAPA